MLRNNQTAASWETQSSCPTRTLTLVPFLWEISALLSAYSQLWKHFTSSTTNEVIQMCFSIKLGKEGSVARERQGFQSWLDAGGTGRPHRGCWWWGWGLPSHPHPPAPPSSGSQVTAEPPLKRALWNSHSVLSTSCLEGNPAYCCSSTTTTPPLKK